jgi:hypothetical protein
MFCHPTRDICNPGHIFQKVSHLSEGLDSWGPTNVKPIDGRAVDAAVDKTVSRGQAAPF